jgi:acyl-CoA hydrolase
MSCKYVTAEEAATLVKSGDRIFIHGAAMTPPVLIDALINRADELKQIEIIHLHTEGQALYATSRYNKTFHTNSLFVAHNLRQAVNEENADYIPIFLSEIHLLFKKNNLRPHIAFIQVSPPDQHGYCSLGASVDITLAATQAAKIVIAEMNDQAPRTHGAGSIHISKIHYAVHTSHPLYAHTPAQQTPVTKKIGNFIATLIEDGATLQMGIGALPEAVLSELHHHRRLAVHTEMFSDGIIPLVEKGIITGEEKKISPGKIVSSFVLGSKKVYDFIHEHAGISMREASYTNDPGIIRMNPKVTAINSAIEIDLTGQVCAESIGAYQYSGVGGQLDFLRAAAISDGGKPIIAMESITHTGESKIVPFLKQGAGVTSTRAHIHYVVTEHGIANLHGLNLRQRAKVLIDIAHPKHREHLEKEAFTRFKHL